MHIPDGFLDTKTWVALNVISAGVLGLAIRKTRDSLGEKQIPLMGVMAAFIFAAQMINFPVSGGTSGHFMGGVLAAILLGPLSAMIVMAVVLIVQCFIFQDGGITALGANIFNMSVIASMGGYLIYWGISKIGGKSKINITAIFIASWLSIILAASVCSVELAISGTVPLNITLPAMAGVHTLIGIGEGLITVLVLSFVLKVRPDLLDLEKA
ncbi:MAG: energy-coupling factor ABC transporter permease [Candidatus Zixiibacteriota bacterium]